MQMMTGASCGVLNATVAAAFAESKRHNVCMSTLAEFTVVLRPAVKAQL